MSSEACAAFKGYPIVPGMGRQPGRASARGLVPALLVLLASTAPAAEAPRRSSLPSTAGPSPAGRATSAATSPVPAKEPRAFLIFIDDGSEPIVVKRYVEEEGQIRFEKYGGWIGIPRHEILRIVPDDPDRVESLPPAPLAPMEPAETVESARADLYVSLKGGGNLKVQAVKAEGERVRVTVPDGSFTVPRSDLLSVVRVPRDTTIPEAWLTLVSAGPPAGAEAKEALHDGGPSPVPAHPPTGEPAAASAAPLDSPAPGPAGPGPGLPYPRSDHPHLLQLGSGQVLPVDGFWVEDGRLRFTRLGGIVGIALSEIARLLPEELAPVAGRTSVRFVQQLGPDHLEVRAQGTPQRVRLLGIKPLEVTADRPDTPWRQLAQGSVVHLEFDRQRYDTDGSWLAYVFLPNGRMLNAELVRLGLATPLVDARNVRYLDLLHEMAAGPEVENPPSPGNIEPEPRP